MNIALLQDQEKVQFLIIDVALAIGLGSMKHFLDLENMEVIHIGSIGESDEIWEKIEETPESYLQITPMSSVDAHEVMRAYVAQLKNEALKNKLAGILDGRKAFTAFRYVLDDYEDFLKQWYLFRDKAYKQQAKQWLVKQGILQER